MDAAVGDQVILTAFGTWAGERIMMVRGYRITATNAGITTDLANATLIKYVRAGALGLDAYESDYLACLPPQYTLDFWRSQIVRPVRTVPIDFLRAAPGTHAEDTETGNQAAVITFRTAFSGRRHVSNVHIGPIPQGPLTQDNGLVTAAYKSLLDTLATNMLNSFSDLATGLTFEPSIFHKPFGPLLYDKITTQVVQNELRTMRRRTVGRGE